MIRTKKQMFFQNHLDYPRRTQFPRDYVTRFFSLVTNLAFYSYVPFSSYRFLSNSLVLDSVAPRVPFSDGGALPGSTAAYRLRARCQCRPPHCLHPRHP